MSERKGCLYELAMLPITITKDVFASRTDRARKTKHLVDILGADHSGTRENLHNHTDSVGEMFNSDRSGEADWAHNELWDDITNGRIK